MSKLRYVGRFQQIPSPYPPPSVFHSNVVERSPYRMRTGPVRILMDDRNVLGFMQSSIAVVRGRCCRVEREKKGEERRVEQSEHKEDKSGVYGR